MRIHLRYIHADVKPGAVLKGEKGIHAACPIISVAVVEDRLI
jgi:hypothetical protein